MLTQEDALRTLVQWIKEKTPSNYSSYGYDVYISNLLDQRSKDRNIQNAESQFFFDAAWELCRRGILRPGVTTVLRESTNEGHSGGGFSLTSFGRTWINEDQDIFVPTEPERFAEMVKPYRERFGPGFYERAQQGIRCYGAHAYLACCAMCGAATESIFLALAIAKAGDESVVLKQYSSSGGRHRIENQILGQANAKMKRDFSGFTDLLKYWRDEASHGKTSGIGDNEAYVSLLMLLRFAMYAESNWDFLTTTQSPA